MNAFISNGQLYLSVSEDAPFEVLPFDGTIIKASFWRAEFDTNTFTIAVIDGNSHLWIYMKTLHRSHNRNKFPCNQFILFAPETTFKTVNVSYYCIAAVDISGNLWVMGRLFSILRFEEFSQFTNNVYFEDVYCRGNKLAALDSDGNLYACGSNRFGEFGTEFPDVISNLTLVKQGMRFKTFSCEEFTLCIDESGDMWACGRSVADTFGVTVTNGEFVKVSQDAKMKTVMQSWEDIVTLTEDGGVFVIAKYFDGERKTPPQGYKQIAQEAGAIKEISLSGEGKLMILNYSGDLSIYDLITHNHIMVETNGTPVNALCNQPIIQNMRRFTATKSARY